MKRIQTILVIFAVVLVAASANAAENNTVGIDPSQAPVNITSDRMIYDEKGGTVTFMDNVVAEHGELTLWSEKLTAFLVAGKKGTSQETIDHIVAEGNVRAKKGTSVGTCGKLTYNVSKQVLKMEKDPTLKDGPNSLSGEIIHYYVRDNRSEVIGGENKRVKAIFVAPGGAQ